MVDTSKFTARVRLNELQALENAKDPKDPIYDSESDGSDVYFEDYRPSPSRQESLKRSNSSYVREPVAQPKERVAILAYPEFNRILTDKILPAAFISEDSRDICESLKELHCLPQYADSFVAKAVRLSLDHSVEKQKWMSELITILYDSKIINRASASRGFEKLIQQADDVRLDVPGAHHKILNFIRCAIDDSVLDQSFTLRLPEVFVQNLMASSAEVPPLPDSTLSMRDLEELQHHLNTLRSFKKAVDKFVVDDFMVSGSQEDLEQLLVDLGHPELRHEVVRRLVKVSMGFSDVERELVSTTLSDRYGSGEATGFTLDDIVVGFVRVLGEIDDITMDVPNAPTLVSKFLVRAVVDEIVPPVVILDCMRLAIGGEEGKNVTKTVKKWVLQEHKGVVHAERFRNIWKSSHPEHTREFKRKIQNLILQHFDDNDVETTCQQLDELEMSPDQAVIFIRKVLELSIERGAREQGLVLELLQALLVKGDLHPEMVRQGFDAAWRFLPDFIIDVPVAREVLLQLTTTAKETKILAEDFAIV